jgi:hypothetical protein
MNHLLCTRHSNVALEMRLQDATQFLLHRSRKSDFARQTAKRSGFRAVIAHSQPFGNGDFMALVKTVSLHDDGFVFRAGERKVAVLNSTFAANGITTATTASTTSTRSH